MYVLRLGITLALLTIAFYQVNLREIFNILVKADLTRLALGMAGFAVMQYAFAWRTKMLLAMQGMPAGVFNIFSLNMASSFYSLVMPSSLAGGMIRWYRLSSVDGERAQAFSIIIFERLCDNIIWLLLFTVAVGSLWLSGEIPMWIAAVSSVGFIVAFLIIWAALAAFIRIDDTRVKKWRFIPTFVVDKLKNIIWAVKNIYLSKKGLIQLILVSLAINVLFKLSIFIALTAFVIEVQFVQFLLVSTISNIVVQLPLTIAGIGLSETLYGRILPLFGIDNVSALCFGVAGSIVTIVWCLMGGGFELLGLGRYHKPADER